MVDWIEVWYMANAVKCVIIEGIRFSFPVITEMLANLTYVVTYGYQLGDVSQHLIN